MINANDAKNLISIMDRATYKGTNEALAAVQLRQKLEGIIKEEHEKKEPKE